MAPVASVVSPRVLLRVSCPLGCHGRLGARVSLPCPQDATVTAVWLLGGWLVGRALSRAGAPDSVKQARYDRALERRAARRRRRSWAEAHVYYLAIAGMLVVAALVHLAR